MIVAKADLETARILAASQLSRQENTFFSLQQAVEKGLKTLLCWYGRPVPLVHDLPIILDRFDEAAPVPHAELIGDWTQGITTLTPAEVQTGLEITAEILSWVEARIR